MLKMGSDIKNICLINGVQYKCRTCFDPGRTVYSLAGEDNNTKSWRDLLKDIAQLQTNDEELLPKTVCCKCQGKLKTFYDFILQIKNVNKTFSQLLANGKYALQSEYLNKNYSLNDCSSESAINLPLEQYMPEIKLEHEMISSYDIDLDRNKLEEEIETKVKNEDSEDSFSGSFDEEFISTLEHLEENEKRSPSESLNEYYNDSDFRIERSSLPSNESDADNISSQHDQLKIPQQPTTFSYDDQIPRHLVQRSITAQSPERTDQEIPSPQITIFSLNDKIDNVDNSFVCLICKKKYTMLGNCRQHIKNIHKYIEQKKGNAHSDDPMDPNVRRWLFGDHIYSKPTAWRLVQCKLCTTNFKTSKELRMHLENHSDVDTLHKLKLADNIVQYMFPNMYNLNSIKESICKDIRKKQWFKYYTVLNEYSYEMSISDTEVEDLEEGIVERANRYKCAFCAKGFSYKYQVFPHLRDAHSNDEIPFKCSQCKLEFISIKMYKKHLETHCQNKYKGLLCAHCPGKFIWPENVKNHNCGPKILAASTTSTEDLDGISNLAKPKIRCGLCAQSFQNLRHLRQHMPLHADGKTGVDFKDCYYITQFENLDSIDLAKMQKQIQDAYTKSQISRYYLAIDKYGNEMDISDSDTDSSTEHTSVEKYYACDLCRETFKRRKYLLDHQHSQHLGALLPFSCMQCQKQFVSIHLLQQHLKRECFNEYRRLAPTCDFCNARFIWPSNMLEHKAIQHPLVIQSFGSMPTRTKSVETATVEKESWFRREEVSKNHMIDISNSECMESEKLHNSNLKSTMEIDISKLFTPTTQNKFQCPSCGVSFSNNSKLTVHIKSRHPSENSFKCSLCETTFNSLSELQTHRLTRAGEHPFQCMFCEKSFVLQCELNNHKRLHKGDRVYQCSTCNKYFTCSAHLRRHCQLMGHTTMWSDLEQEPKVPEEYIPKAKNKSLCPFCGIYLSGNTSLTLHIRTHTGEKPFKCDLCEMAFIRRGDLIGHRRVHTHERPFKCPHCEKSFTKNYKLTIHIRVHTGERPYHCTFCKKKFGKSEYLKLHLRSHTGERPYKCEICGQAFACGAYLKKHRISKGHQVGKIDSNKSPGTS